MASAAGPCVTCAAWGGRIYAIGGVTAGGTTADVWVLDAAHSVPVYWYGKNKAASLFGTGPVFGGSATTMLAWFNGGGGRELYRELTQDIMGLNVVGLLGFPMPAQPFGWFKTEVTKADQLKGFKYRTVGLAADLLQRMGMSVAQLPGGEIVPAMERGVIDAAEFSSPAINYPMGFDEITKYAIQPGVHQPGIQCALFFNKDSYNKLPDDLKWIIDIAAKETQLWANTWQENLNAEAVKLFKEKVEFVRMDEDTINSFAKASHEYIEGLKAKYPDVKKVMDSQDQFKADFADWRQERGGIAPWPYEMFVKGQHMQ